MDDTYANSIICRLVDDEKGPLSLTLTEFVDQTLVVAIRMNMATQDVYRVYREGENYVVALMKGKGYEEGVNGDGKYRATWTDAYDRFCEQQVRLIEAVVPAAIKSDAPLNLQFLTKCIELGAYINRYTFDSSVGRIRKHGKQVGERVEGCIELCELGTCINLLSTASRTKITGIGDSVPF